MLVLLLVRMDMLDFGIMPLKRSIIKDGSVEKVLALIGFLKME